MYGGLLIFFLFEEIVSSLIFPCLDFLYLLVSVQVSASQNNLSWPCNQNSYHSMVSVSKCSLWHLPPLWMHVFLFVYLLIVCIHPPFLYHQWNANSHGKRVFVWLFITIVLYVEYYWTNGTHLFSEEWMNHSHWL